jgi:flagellar motor component MotA
MFITITITIFADFNLDFNVYVNVSNRHRRTGCLCIDDTSSTLAIICAEVRPVVHNNSPQQVDKLYDKSITANPQQIEQVGFEVNGVAPEEQQKLNSRFMSA